MKIMSDDLISRKTVMEEISSLRIGITGLMPGEEIYNQWMEEYRKSILRILDEAPIAYDVDKVVEQLKDKIEITWNHDYLGGRKDAFNEAIEVVKGGEVDEQQL